MYIYNLSSTLDGTQERNPELPPISTPILLASNGGNSEFYEQQNTISCQTFSCIGMNGK